MSIFPLLATLAALAAVYALVSGISSMAADGEVQHLNSTQWMFRRVAFQAVAFAFVLLGLFLAA